MATPAQPTRPSNSLPSKAPVPYPTLAMNDLAQDALRHFQEVVIKLDNMQMHKVSDTDYHAMDDLVLSMIGKLETYKMLRTGAKRRKNKRNTRRR
jgi:hypothetical protein